MAKLSKAFGIGGKYFKASDLDEFAEMQLTIDRLEEVVFGERDSDGSERKWVLFFKEDPRGLVMNATNVKLLIEIHGDREAFEYSGRRVVLYRMMTEYQGTPRPGVRLRPVAQDDSQAIPF